MLLTCLDVSCVIICREDWFTISWSYFAEWNLGKNFKYFLVFNILNWMTFTIYIASEHYLTSALSYQYLCVYSTGIRNPEELSVMKFMDKDDLKKNIKEHLNTKKKRDSLHDQMPASNGVNHSNSGSLDRLSPYPNRSPAGPSPNVSTSPDFIGWCLDHCIANIKDVVIS